MSPLQLRPQEWTAVTLVVQLTQGLALYPASEIWGSETQEWQAGFEGIWVWCKISSSLPQSPPPGLPQSFPPRPLLRSWVLKGRPPRVESDPRRSVAPAGDEAVLGDRAMSSQRGRLRGPPPPRGPGPSEPFSFGEGLGKREGRGMRGRGPPARGPGAAAASRPGSGCGDAPSPPPGASGVGARAPELGGAC